MDERNNETINLDILKEMAELNIFTEAEQDVLICLLKGMDFGEIVEELGITRNAARCRKKYAIKKYDKFLEQKKKS